MFLRYAPVADTRRASAHPYKSGLAGITRAALMIFCCSAASLSVWAGGCQDPSITWTIYSTYSDPLTSLPMTPAITGDGLQTDSGGNTVYTSINGKVTARLNNCGTHPSYDATLQLYKGRTFNVNLAIGLGNDYQKFPPTYSFFKQGGLLNISDIQWCQNNGFPNGCTFYTRLTSALDGPDGKTYHLRMETPSAVSVTSWLPDLTANCPYATSPVQVVFTPGSLDPSGKDTYVVTPVLQGTNTGTDWTAPPQSSGCPVNSSLPSGTWPAGVAVLIQETSGNSYNYGQYDVPFKFVIQNP